MPSWSSTFLALAFVFAASISACHSGDKVASGLKQQPNSEKPPRDIAAAYDEVLRQQVSVAGDRVFYFLYLKGEIYELRNAGLFWQRLPLSQDWGQISGTTELFKVGIGFDARRKFTPQGWENWQESPGKIVEAKVDRVDGKVLATADGSVRALNPEEMQLIENTERPK